MTSRSFDAICDGEVDDINEQAFLYVGDNEEVRAKAKGMEATRPFLSSRAAMINSWSRDASSYTESMPPVEPSRVPLRDGTEIDMPCPRTGLTGL